MRTRLLAVFLAASAAACGTDRDFDRLVQTVQTRFGVQQTHIPLMGVANFFVKVTRPEGVSGFRLAVFDHLNFDEDGDGAALDRIMAAASEGLHPLVRVRSHRDREWTYIYTGEEGKITRMLVATFARGGATVVETKLNMDTLLRALGHPARAGKDLGR